MSDEEKSTKSPPDQEHDDSKPTEAAAASSTTPPPSDMTIAQMFFAMDQLINVFGFDEEIAQQAVEAVGASDVQLCYNYILDNNLSSDSGGPVVPIANCPHVQHHVRLSPQQLPSPRTAVCDYYNESSSVNNNNDKTSTGKAKGDVNEDGSCPPGENWLCLECGVVRCSRYVNGHGVEHYQDSLVHDAGVDSAGHCIAASLADLSVWCHACSAYLRHSDLDVLIKKLERLKFLEDVAEDSIEEEAEEEQQVSANEMPNVGRGLPLSLGDPITMQFWTGGIRMQSLYEQQQQPIDYPFGTLPTDLSGVADFIRSDQCKSIIVLSGAGMSVSSGIPDFRSVGGLYNTMQPELLTATEMEREAIRVDPTVALEQGMFLQNPLPCLELNRPFILGTREQKWKATLAHRFVELLHSKTNKLTRLYTQNIDGLEGQCHNLPRDKVIAVHGSMDRAECARCGSTSDFDAFCDQVQTNIKDISGQDPTAPKESTPIYCQVCGNAAVKPSIVLFRSNLPDEFFERVPQDVPEADLLIVIGTSLAVAPANTLVYRVNPFAMRVVVNNEPVGMQLGIQYGQESTRDYFAQGSCETVLLELMSHLGWLDDLAPLLADRRLPETSAELLRSRLESGRNKMKVDEDDG